MCKQAGRTILVSFILIVGLVTILECGEVSSANKGEGGTTLTISGGNFCVHIKHLGNGIEYYEYVTPTFRFVLIDAAGSQCNIEALRCQYDGDWNEGQYYSECGIDKISLVGPAVTEMITYTDYSGHV